MTSMRILLLFVSLLIFPFGTDAQHPFNPNAGGDRPCGFDEHHAYLMKTDPAYKTRHVRQKAILDSLKYAPVRPERQGHQVFTIPVVVHVIHLGESAGYQTNIPDSQILDAITGLNERFANINGLGTDTEINFCLANRDPYGCPTSGINRIDGSAIPDYEQEGITYGGDCGADEVAIKDLSKWPIGEYYNIWVVHDICGDIAGYAYYPNGGEYDGTVIDIASMKYEIGTLAHELGHGLNLKHTFSGEEDDECPMNVDCLEDGDEICDTPPHRRDDCGFNNLCSTEGIWANSQYNWMSYCHPPVEIGRFTADQRTRVWDALSVEPRASLLSSQGCSNEVRMNITSDGSILCRHESRLLTAEPDGGFFILVSGSGYIQENILTATGGTEIVVEYRIEQETCTSSVFQVMAVKPIPNSLLRSAEDTLCIGQTTSLQGFPAGGTYEVISGPGVVDSNLLTAEDAGVITLLYEKLHSGCIVRDTHVVESFTFPVADISILSADMLKAVADTGLFQWLRCDLAYEAIPDAKDATYQVTHSGSYAVVSVNGTCRDTSDCIDVTITATHDDQNNDLRIYPNPVKDVFYLDDLDPGEAEIMVFDLRGVRIHATINQEQGRMSIDISDFVPGVYVLQVDVAGVGRLVYRVVKV